MSGDKKTDNNSPDLKFETFQNSRQELRDRIQTLEWSLAQKNRENKKLKEEVKDCKEENAVLTAENESLKHNASNGNEDSSTS